ncbi:hypothetical protein PHAVU_008G078100 [Phaseolus vulgaris]|uniref:Uncharacterized protein n=1 Tax=Phaseolus vulgaris TaxID=3885 RepID=V7B6B5_PHAVU|nr:hypothetical protein PHAVU_008G078100g [Phaseolus vulgaris]ESW12021.1 hypothetical protein PHAVU_008G078100g [Phaseolus vulgaris]
MKLCQRRTFWAHREPIIGMLGQGQPDAQFSKAAPVIACMYSRLLSSLKVMDKLTKAAIGRGRNTGEPPTIQQRRNS